MEDLYKALEEINKEKCEIKRSAEYKLGHAIKMYYTDFLKFRIKKITRNLKNKKAKKIIRKKYYRPCKYEYKENNIDNAKARIAVYTCILGEYDDLQVPLVEFDNVDYYILTDNKNKYEKYKNTYKIVKLSTEILEKGNIIANRYVKFHPNEFFEDYDYTIYLDGNVRVISDIRTFINRCSKETGIAMHAHRERDCIFDEAEVCKLLGRGNANKINEQINRYKEEGFPKKFGMNEATVIVSEPKNEIAIKLLNEWYLEFVKSESMRDQLAWPYVLWRNKYKITDVGNLGDNIYENYKVEMVSHDKF